MCNLGSFFSFQEFAFKRIFNESALRDCQFWCQVLQCHINHVRSVGIWPPWLNTFSNIRSFFLHTCIVCVCMRARERGYICRECYVLKCCLCVLSFFSLFLSMWSVWWLLYINYSRRKRTKSKIGFLSYILIFWWPQMISIVCLYLTPI